VSRSETAPFFGLRRLQPWHAKMFLRAITMPDTNASARHEYLHHVVPALPAERAAETGRGGAEYLEASARFAHRIERVLELRPVGPRLQRREEGQEPTELQLGSAS